MTRRLHLPLLGASLLAWVACAEVSGDLSFAGETPEPCETAESVGELPGALLEASGVVRDPRRPDLYWAHNDSGNPAELIAIDGSGRLLGIAPVAGVDNRDMEDIALGSCPTGSCFYLADIGDNLAVHSAILVHRLPLPEPPPARNLETGGSDPLDSGASRALETVRPDTTWRFVYPTGPRDAEALAVDPERGELIIVTKGREDVIELYTAPLRSDDSAADGVAREREPPGPQTLRRIGRLPLPIGAGTSQFVTAADLSPDGTVLAVRSYSTLYRFRWPGAAAFDTLAQPEHSPLLGALEAQGEGLAWDGDGETLLLVSEGRANRPPTLSRIRCPVP